MTHTSARTNGVHTFSNHAPHKVHVGRSHLFRNRQRPAQNHESTRTNKSLNSKCTHTCRHHCHAAWLSRRPQSPTSPQPRRACILGAAHVNLSGSSQTRAAAFASWPPTALERSSSPSADIPYSCWAEIGVICEPATPMSPVVVQPRTAHSILAGTGAHALHEHMSVRPTPGQRLVRLTAPCFGRGSSNGKRRNVRRGRGGSCARPTRADAVPALPCERAQARTGYGV